MSDPVPAIVGGSAEALALARLLPGAPVRLPAGDRLPREWPGPVETGDVTTDWVSRTGASALVIAPHPFDAHTARAAARAAKEVGLPVLFLRRAGWSYSPGSRIVRIAAPSDLARIIPPGVRVFAATGREDLAALRRLRARLYLRRIGSAAERVAGAIVVPGTPPFTVPGEMALLRRLSIDWLVLRDAGGPGARPKLDAALRLGLRVALIRRPAWPEGPTTRTSEEAALWLKRTIPSAASS